MNSLLEAALLYDTHLFVRISMANPSDMLVVQRGASATPLDLLEMDSPLRKLLPERRGFPLPDSGEMLNGAEDVVKVAQIYVNLMPDWTLSYGKTVQIEINEPHTHQHIPIATKLEIQASSDTLYFHALVGVHYAAVQLRLHVTDIKTGTIETLTHDVDRAKTGGKVAMGYDRVLIPISPCLSDKKISFDIQYLGYLNDTGENKAPYVFIACPKVVSKSAISSLYEPLERAFHMSDAGSWYYAQVPNFKRGDTEGLFLLQGTENLGQLFGPENTRVSLVEDHGHTLVFRATQEREFLIYLDGVAVDRLELGIDPTAYRIPAKFLLGQETHLSVRSLAGNQVFFEEYFLPPRILTPEDVMARNAPAPYSTSLSNRSKERFEGLKRHLANRKLALPADDLLQALRTLECNYETLRVAPLNIPAVKKPDVSIIIPAYNQVAATYYCLCALLVAANDCSFEVILVDDGSTDETTLIEDIVTGIKVVRHSEPLGFIGAVNAGAELAQGAYIALLNNDTEPTAGWLDALIEGFETFDNVGLTGGKLLYPDGKLQEAGGIVWKSGNPWNYGRGDNPYEPKYNYARQVDYVSGAAMMTRKEIWQELGGFSSYLEPMYFEDTDFAFKVRKAGYATYYIPGSRIYHFEGVTSGTETNVGPKRYQEVNRPKFKRKWADAFKFFGEEGYLPDLEKDRGIRGRVLFIDYSTPRGDMDAGSYAALQEIALVQSLGYKVTFLPQNLAHLGAYTEALERKGVEVITAPFYLSLEEFLNERGTEFDVAYITRYYVARETLHLIRSSCPSTKVVLNNADLHFLRELRAGLIEEDKTRLDAIADIRDQELDMMIKADVVLSYSEVEHAVITSHTNGQAKVMKCPWIVTGPDKVAPLSKRQGLSFFGSFNHHPNREGLDWFLDKVFPLLSPQSQSLYIYGSGMQQGILDRQTETVHPVGFVENVSQAYNHQRIFIAPLLSGAGIKGKVLGALAYGVPVVLTPIAAEGIGLRNGHDCLIVDTSQDWADAIEKLTVDDALWHALSQNAKAFVADTYSFDHGRKMMKLVFEALEKF